HRAQLDVRRLDDAGVRRVRLRVQEAPVSARAARARDCAGRSRRSFLPPGDARLAGRNVGVLLQRARRLADRARAVSAVLAAAFGGAGKNQQKIGTYPIFRGTEKWGTSLFFPSRTC